MRNFLRKHGGKVAVIGSGPAGLTVAGDLARQGFNVTIFESQAEPGGGVDVRHSGISSS